MAKYTEERIIAYLKTLRAGDVLTAVEPYDGYITAGDEYVVKDDFDGDLVIFNDMEYPDYVGIGGNYDSSVSDILDYIADGVFEIPTPKAAPKPFTFRLAKWDLVDGEVKAEVTTDSAGLDRLQALMKESGKHAQLAELKKRRDAIQSEIDLVEAGL